MELVKRRVMDGIAGIDIRHRRRCGPPSGGRSGRTFLVSGKSFPEMTEPPFGFVWSTNHGSYISIAGFVWLHQMYAQN